MTMFFQIGFRSIEAFNMYRTQDELRLILKLGCTFIEHVSLYIYRPTPDGLGIGVRRLSMR